MRAQEDLRLGGHAAAVEARLARWEAEGFGRRLWEKDHTLWSPTPVPELADRLGWLELPESMAGQAEALARFGEEARAEGFRETVVLGMGGSSLAPEVYARTFGAAGTAAGFPALTVLDSTHPDAVHALAVRIDPARTLFVVSSKSGTTTETLSFFRAFWDLAAQTGSNTGRQFVAVTDPGTPLERLARERGFRAVWNAPEEVGGRYSALTTFGLVPAALLGVDLGRLLASARAMAAACGPGVQAMANPGLRLGAAMGELALAGRDKLTLVTSQGIESFPDWLEQLIAESTGKIGRGIVPVVCEPLGPPSCYGPDRFFVALILGEKDPAQEERLAVLEAAGHPVARIGLTDAYDLGAEMFRFEVATAAAGAVLGVNPFDQPDVQLAKELAGKAMKEGAAGGGDSGVRTRDGEALRGALTRWLAGARPGDYLGLHAYLPPTPRTTEVLHALQSLLHERTRLAVTMGYGPRFLHSTGQLHKGGPGTCRFLQILDEPVEDVPVPETGYTFGELIRAQAEGDRRALEQRGREVLRIRLNKDEDQGLRRLLQDLGEALGA
jgi:transaldolase/glucose-6-phosphate isomerase